MDIKTKYKIGDEVFIIRNNQIEKVSIINFKLIDDISKNLEERLKYILSCPKTLTQTEILKYWYNNMDLREESEIHLNIEDLLNFLKKEYNGNK